MRTMAAFQRLFPDDDSCRAWLERVKWPHGFRCPHCGRRGEPVRLNSRPGVLACRVCRKQTSLTVGMAMEGSHLPLTLWVWGAKLLTTRPGISVAQFQRELGLSRYATAYEMLRKLRAGLNQSKRNPSN